MEARLVKRNIRCIVWIILKTYPIAVLCIAIILGMEILSGEEMKEIIRQIPRIIVFFNSYILTMVAVSVAAGYFPIMLSMGSGKYSFFVGKHITYIMFVIVLSTVDIMVYVVADKFKFSNCLMVVGGMLSVSYTHQTLPTILRV